MAYTYKDYEESDAVKKAREILAQNEANKPGPYQSQNTDQLNGLMQQYQSRGPFQYDMQKDPLYGQYREQYGRDAKMAMMDTMGQAAGMTGGYGSSYAQAAGQQAYTGEMQKLNDRMPELYQMSLAGYQQQGEDLMRRYQMLSDKEAQDYSRYQDAEAAWRNDRNYAASRLDTESAADYDRYNDQWARDWKTHTEDQEQARKEAEYYIKSGKTPPDSILQRAGYDPEYVKYRVKRIKEQQAAAGGEMSVEQYARRAKAAGATPEQIYDALRNYYKVGEDYSKSLSGYGG